MCPKENIQEVKKIEEQFNIAFSKLKPEKIYVPKSKKLHLAMNTSHGNIYEMGINEEGKVSFVTIDNELVKTHYLKNRFMIKETPFYLYLMTQKKARLEGLAGVGAIEKVPDTETRQDVFLYALDDTETPVIGQFNFEEFDNVTHVTDNIYLAEKFGVLLALEVGIKPDENEVELESEEEAFINSYV